MKQFIRNVRAAKTIADERAVVQKESAAIRASFREESGDSNVRWVPPTPQPEGHLFICVQEKQCREVAVSLHPRRADAFWPDRMSEAAGISALCGQAPGLPGDHAAAGREPGGVDLGHKLAQKVRPLQWPL